MSDSAIAHLASRQHGLFSRQQAVDLGATDSSLQHRVQHNRLRLAAPGVYSLPGFADTWHRRLWIAHLDAGPHSVISHEAAAALHRLLHFPPGPVTLLTAHGDHHRPEAGQQPGHPQVRQARDLRPEHVTRIAGLPVTTIPRTFCDLAATSRRGRIERALEDAHITRRCRIGEVASLATELCRPGKRGLPWLVKTLSDRGPGAAVPESELEAMLLKVLRAGGFRNVKLQHELPWRPDVPNRVDALLEGRIIVEADSRRWHGRLDAMAEDRRRDREAQLHGYDVFRFLYEEVKHDPDEVCRVLHQAVARRAGSIAA